MGQEPLPSDHPQMGESQGQEAPHISWARLDIQAEGQSCLQLSTAVKTWLLAESSYSHSWIEVTTLALQGVGMLGNRVFRERLSHGY